MNTAIYYNEFLFYTLIQSVNNPNHPLTELSYDLAFREISKYYLEFCKSKYNDKNLSEYDAIINYINNY